MQYRKAMLNGAVIMTTAALGKGGTANSNTQKQQQQRFKSKLKEAICTCSLTMDSTVGCWFSYYTPAGFFVVVSVAPSDAVTEGITPSMPAMLATAHRYACVLVGSLIKFLPFPVPLLNFSMGCAGSIQCPLGSPPAVESAA
jgi:hypothetical protein